MPEAARVSATLHKLNVYEPGGFFKAHRVGAGESCILTVGMHISCCMRSCLTANVCRGFVTSGHTFVPLPQPALRCCQLRLWHASASLYAQRSAVTVFLDCRRTRRALTTFSARWWCVCRCSTRVAPWSSATEATSR